MSQVFGLNWGWGETQLSVVRRWGRWFFAPAPKLRVWKLPFEPEPLPGTHSLARFQKAALTKSRINAAEGEEVVVAAALDDAAAVHDEDLVGVADGREAVGDDEAGALRHEPVERLLDEPLGLRVHARGGFVEDEDGRVFEQRAGDGNALLFADAELYPALADDGAEALRQPIDKLAGVGNGERVEEFGVGRGGFAEAEVVADRAVEKEALLRDHPPSSNS